MGIFDDKTTSTSSTNATTGQTGTSAQQQTGTSSQSVTGGTQQNIPTFLAQHQADTIGLTNQAASQAGVAGLSADEQQAIAQQRANQGNWTPGLSAAINLATTASATPSATDISKFSNPYLQGNLAAQQRNLQQGLQTQLGGLAGQDISSGAFGGSRGARAAAQAVGQGYADLADRQNAAQAADWTQANQLYNQNTDRQSRGATQLANLATQLQQQGQGDVTGLLSTGKLQRDLEQKGIDLPFDTASRLANIGTTVGNNVARGTTNWSNTAGQTGSSTTGQTSANTNQRSDTTTKGTQGKSSASQLLGALGLLGNNSNILGSLFGGGGGGGGGGNPLGSLISGGANAVRGLFGGGGGGGSYANPYEGGWGGGGGSWEDSDAWGQGWGDWKDGGTVKMANGGQVDPALQAMLQQQQLGLNQLQQKQEKQLGFGADEPALFAEGGQAQGENNVDPMQALDVLAQAGCPPELLQQCAQSIQGGQGGGMPPGGAPAGPMACGGLAHAARGGMMHMNQGGMMHMNQGGGAYGIDPEMLRRIMASGQNPMGGQSANPMAPGHMGAGRPMMSGLSNASPEQQRMDLIRRREESMRGMHASPMAR